MQKSHKLIGILLILLIVSLGLILTVQISALFRQDPGRTALPEIRTFENGRNPLPIPPILEDQNPDAMTADYDLTVQNGQTAFFPGLMTETLGYNGSFLGPVIRLRRGQQVQIRVENQLNQPTTIHWHGMELSGDADGGPHQPILPDEIWEPFFSVDQPAATLWYHPHLAGTTGPQVYQGLAGLIYIEDEISDQLPIPKDYGVNDIPLIVQDRNFSADGSFNYEISMMGLVPGDHMLINGALNPYLEVKREKIRLRILNGSNFENYFFQFSDGSAFHQIATDGGFLEAPVLMEGLFLSPGERAEIVVDFDREQRDDIFLMAGRRPIMEFRISEAFGETLELPDQLTEVPQIPVDENTTVREFVLDSMGLQGTINGRSFDMDRIDETIDLNETEIWVIRNRSRMMHSSGHPFHVHGTQFQIISRNGSPPPLEERGFKDTVYVDPGEEVVIAAVFDEEGLFMYHCHMLEHEDYGMMGQFIVR